MTKLHRPEFVKEYIKSEEDTAEKPDEIKEGESTVMRTGRMKKRKTQKRVDNMTDVQAKP